MKIINTYCIKDEYERQLRQSELYRRCIMLLHTRQKRGSLYECDLRKAIR